MALSSYWVSRRRKDLAEQAIVSKREKEAVHAKKCQEVASFHQDLARKCTKYKYLEEAKVLTTPRMREESYVLENQRVAAKEKIDSRRQKLAQLLDVEHKQFMKELKELKEMNREKDPWNITQLKIQMEDLQRQRRETEQNMQKRYLCHMLPSSARSHSSEKENETLERETVVAWEDCKQELERLNLEKQQREQEKLRQLQTEKAEAAHEADKIESLHLTEQAKWSNTIESKISELNTADSESKKLEMEKGILLEHLETLFSLKRRRDAVRDIQRKACQKIQTLYQPNEKMRKMLTEVKHGLEFDYKMLSAMSDLNIDLDEVMAAKEKISMQIALERERELEILQLYQEETSRIWEEKKEQWMLELIAWDEIMNKLFKSLVSQMKEKIDLIESEEKRLINLKENLLEEIDKINLQTKDSCMTLESKHRYYVDQVDKLHVLSTVLKRCSYQELARKWMRARRFGTKCGGCSQGICPTDLVRRARGRVYHVACFTCLLCRKQPSTGEELYVLDETRFVCKDDFNRQQQHVSSSPLDSPEESLGSPQGDSSIVVSGGSGANSPHNNTPNSEEPVDCLVAGPSSNDEAGGGTKRRGPRTTIKAKQLETLKAAFAATPKPTRHIREQLAQETGLNMRVIQVWFQNRRSKERRMKQLSNLGARRHFFRNPRRAMRPLRAGLMDEAVPHNAFAYFSDSNSPNDFNYGPHPAFYDYFPSSHPQGGITDFPGTVPITAGGNNTLEHSNTINNGVTPVEASYMNNNPDCLGSRSSPENPLSNLQEVSYSSNGRPQQRPPDGTPFAPFMPNHIPPHMNDTRVW